MSIWVEKKGLEFFFAYPAYERLQPIYQSTPHVPVVVHAKPARRMLACQEPPIKRGPVNDSIRRLCAHNQQSKRRCIGRRAVRQLLRPPTKPSTGILTRRHGSQHVREQLRVRVCVRGVGRGFEALEEVDGMEHPVAQPGSTRIQADEARPQVPQPPHDVGEVLLSEETHFPVVVEDAGGLEARGFVLCEGGREKE